MQQRSLPVTPAADIKLIGAAGTLNWIQSDTYNLEKCFEE